MLTLVLNNYCEPNLVCCCLNGPCDNISTDPEQRLVGTVAFELVGIPTAGQEFLSVCLSILKCQLCQSESICAVRRALG